MQLTKVFVEKKISLLLVKFNNYNLRYSYYFNYFMIRIFIINEINKKTKFNNPNIQFLNFIILFCMKVFA